MDIEPHAHIRKVSPFAIVHNQSLRRFENDLRARSYEQNCSVKFYSSLKLTYPKSHMTIFAAFTLNLFYRIGSRSFRARTVIRNVTIDTKGIQQGEDV